MFQNRAKQVVVLRFLAFCGVVVPVIFAMLLIVAGFLYEGYSHVSQAISELVGVEATQPIVQNASFLISGLLIVAFAFGLHLGIGGIRGSNLGPVLIGVFGVSSGMANALLPCDPGCEFQSLAETMHNVVGLGGS